MDIFDQPVYAKNKFYLRMTGLWPYTKLSKQHLIIIIILAIGLMAHIATKVNFIVAFYKDTDLVFDSLAPVIGNLVMVGKGILYWMKLGKLKKLLDTIKYDWAVIKESDEIRFLQTYSEQNERLLTYYVRFICVTMGLFMLTPLVPHFLGLRDPSLPRPIPQNLNYFVDNDDYYYPILLHAFIAVGTQLMIWIATDGTFIACVQHACAMFCIIEYGLNHLLPDKDVDRDLKPSLAEDPCYHKVKECVIQHIHVLSYADLLESMYSSNFLYQAALNTIIMSVTAVRATTTLKSSPQVAFRHLAFTVGEIVHLMFECYQCQKLIDHSGRVEKGMLVNSATMLLSHPIKNLSSTLMRLAPILCYSMNSVWYLTSFKSRQLIRFMLLRAQKPTVLTAGKLFVVSMEFFSAVIRTAISYFTVLGSLE